MSLPLRERLRADVVERSEALGWKRHRASTFEIDSYAEDPEWLAQYRQVFWGHGSLTVMDTKERFVDVWHWPVTDGELGRAYLRHMVEHYGVKPTYQGGFAREGMKLRAPLYCEPVRRLRPLSYIDLRHAYWALLRPHPWDTMFLPSGDLISPLGSLRWLWPDEVDADRGIRLAVHGTLFAKGFSWWRYGKWVEYPYARDSFTQPSLYHVVFSTLHAIARDVLRHFPVHAWLTDACIVDHGAESEVRAFLAERWAMASTVKGRGFGWVHNVGSYRIGGNPSPRLDLEIRRWTEDQDERRGRARFVPIRKVARLNVTYWRELREEARADAREDRD